MNGTIIAGIKKLFYKRCKFIKTCPYYEKESRTCNQDGGMYYNFGKGGGCFRNMEEKK
jgi:hypothetical protein